MKNFRLTILLGMVLSITLISCEKDEKRVDPPVETPAVGDDIFTAKLNGIEWTASSMRCIISTKGITTLEGTAVGGTTIVVHINDTVENSYILNMLSPHVGNVDVEADDLVFSTAKNLATGGQFDIISINKQASVIEGTFAFTGYNSTSSEFIEVTDGVFKDIVYVVEEPSIEDNSLQANIDGDLFIADTVTGMVPNDTILYIVGKSIPDTTYVRFELPVDIEKSVYILSPNGAYRGFYKKNDTTQEMISFSGTITIEDHQDIHQTIEGKFEFNAQVPGTLTDAILTNGSFQLFYEKGIKDK